MRNYSLLFIPGILILVLPLIKALCGAHAENVRRQQAVAEKEAREKARREALAKAKDEREAAKAAEEASKAAAPKRKPGRPRKTPVAEQRPETISPTLAKPEPSKAAEAPSPAPLPFTICGNNAFAGETVAFTGTILGMTRREAIEAVEKNGGKAFSTMPAATTILVVGDNPGQRKLDAADKWASSVRKITAMEFGIMLQRPLTLSIGEFEALVRSLYNIA